MTNKPPYRFTAEWIEKLICAEVCGETVISEEGLDEITARLNARLAEWEAGSEKLYANLPDGKAWEGYQTESDTHQAILWNPQEINLLGGPKMKVLCVKCEFDAETKTYVYVFQSLDKGDCWVAGEMRMSAEKPNRYTVGESYECKIEI